MLDDVLHEVLPLIGFAVCATALFTLIVMRRGTRGTLKFCQFFACTDFLCGLATIYAGFHGVIVTTYGITAETVLPASCLVHIHLVVFLLTDYMQIVLLVWFALDRLLQILIPKSHGKVNTYYMVWKTYAVLSCLTTYSLVPAFRTSIENWDNATVRVPSQCRFDDVVGDDFYLQHILTVQWAPIACIGILSVTFLIYGIRQTKHMWSYKWAEEKSLTRQLLATCFIRCFLAGLSVHLPLLYLARTPEGHDSVPLRDLITRLSSSIVVSVLQPFWYLLMLKPFQVNVSALFNKYSANTQRQWQSAADPPQEFSLSGSRTNVNRYGEHNPFGSWYSMAGNVTGEAGIPIGNERSISFYCDKI